MLPVLAQEVERHITEHGVTEFVVGHYGGFDRLAASAVREAKKRHPEITLTLLLPYHPHDQFIPVPEGFDGTFYPPGMETVPKRAAIVRANRYMLEHSSCLIAYVSHPSSGSREVLEAALRRRERPIIGRITHEQFLLDTRPLWGADFDYIAEAAAEGVG